MDEPAITVIIALYNGAPFIEDALNSVFSQTLAPAAIIVVDDGSTDDGPAIVERLARSRDIVLLRKSNGGQSSARNMGFSHVVTPLVALLDQDDVWYPCHLERLVVPFRDSHDPLLGWVYSNLDTIDRDGKLVIRGLLDTFPATEHPKRTLQGCLANDMFVVPSASLINVEAFKAVGGFDERLIGYEDDDLFLRIFRRGYRNIYLRESLCQWRVFSGSASRSSHMTRSRITYFQKLHQIFDDGGPSQTHLADLYVAPRFFKATLLDYQRALHAGDMVAQSDALRHLRALLPHLDARLRLLTRMGLPLTHVMRCRPVGRMAATAGSLLWGAYKRILT